MSNPEASVETQASLSKILSNLEIDQGIYRRLHKSQSISLASLDSLTISVGISDAEKAQNYYGIFWFSRNFEHKIEIFPENMLAPVEVIEELTADQVRRANADLSYRMSRTLVHETLHHKVQLLREDYEAALARGNVNHNDFAPLKPFGLKSWKDLRLSVDPAKRLYHQEEGEVRRRDQQIMRLCPWASGLVLAEIKKK